MDEKATAEASGAKNTQPKPKPRAGVQRKTRAEREQYAKDAAERQKARLTEGGVSTATRGGARGSRQPRGRGGDTAGAREERFQEPASTGGVFGAGRGVKPSSRPRAMVADGQSELLDGLAPANALSRLPNPSAGASSTSIDDVPTMVDAGDRSTVLAKKVGDIQVSSDDEPDESKRDIERIWISSDDDSDVVSSRRGKKITRPRNLRPGTGLRPVRAPRILKEEDEALPTSQKKVRGAKNGEYEGLDAEDDEMDVDELDPLRERHSSPELRRRSVKKILGKARGAKSAMETIEERAERLRVADDIAKLREIFTQPDSFHGAPLLETRDPPTEATGTKDGKLLLFQLPPLTPFLNDTTSTPEDQDVKHEPGDPNAPTASKDSSGTGPTQDPDAKKDHDSPPPKPPLQQDGVITAVEPTRLPAGLVGKLCVHKSGKVSLNWGGTDMEVRYGSEVDFLQDLVMVKPGVKTETGQDEATDHMDRFDGPPGKEVAGAAYALGQVKQKLVLIPDWAKLYD